MSPRRLTVVLLAAILTSLLTAGPAAARAAAFRDTEGSVHAPAVSVLAARQIVLGCTSSRFCPNDTLTRGQVASLLVRALDLEPRDDGRFADTAGSVHAGAIGALAAAGMTRGCDDRRYCPNDAITRGQLASLLTRAFDLPAAPSGTYFTDSNGTHGPSIDAMAHGGIAAGCTLIEFCPGDRLTRAQGATFLARGLGLVDRVRLAPFAERRAEHEATTRASSADAAASRAVEVAREQVGRPYRYGGTSPAGFDCSGLTGYAWHAAGVDLPRSSRDQRAATRSVSRGDLEPGDLVFYNSPVSHVAMYIGGGRTVEAANPRVGVRIANDGLSRSGIVGYGRPR